MSVAVALQDMVLAVLQSDATVAGLVAGRIYDHVPPNRKYPHISFGPYNVTSDDAECIGAGSHALQVDIWSRAVGAVEAKQITDAARRAIHGYEGDMGAFGLVEMRVDFAEVIGDPDGLTAHGIITVTAEIEEPV